MFEATWPSGDKVSLPLCENQESGVTSLSSLLTYYISIWIVILSYIYRLILSCCVKLVGITSRTLETKLIMVTIFLIYLINYCLMYLNAPRL